MLRLWGDVQSAEEPVLPSAAASEPAALAPALYLTWLINSDMTPGRRVTPVLGRGTSGLLFGTGWYPPVPKELHHEVSFSCP